jgi:hypothetical protein
MRKLVIEVFTPDNQKPIIKLIAARFDATKHITVIGRATNYKEPENLRLIEEIDHFNLMEGMITIYYRSGAYMEITRLNV